MLPTNANNYTNREQYIDTLTNLVGNSGTSLAVKNGALTSVEKVHRKAAMSSSMAEAQGISTASVVELKLMEFLFIGRKWLESKEDFEKVDEVAKKVGLNKGNTFKVAEHRELNALIGLLVNELVNQNEVEFNKYHEVCNEYVNKYSKEFAAPQLQPIVSAVKATFDTIKKENMDVDQQGPEVTERRTSGRLRDKRLSVDTAIKKEKTIVLSPAVVQAFGLNSAILVIKDKN